MQGGGGGGVVVVLSGCVRGEGLWTLVSLKLVLVWRGGVG